jgi:CCR4-NOT transcriptional regulation complex NOT5 subunit
VSLEFSKVIERASQMDSLFLHLLYHTQTQFLSSTELWKQSWAFPSH